MVALVDEKEELIENLRVHEGLIPMGSIAKFTMKSVFHLLLVPSPCSVLIIKNQSKTPQRVLIVVKSHTAAGQRPPDLRLMAQAGGLGRSTVRSLVMARAHGTPFLLE